MRNIGQYYLQFDTSHTRFISYDQLDISKAMAPGTNIYIMDDWLTEFLSNTDRSKTPMYLQKVDTSFAEKVYDYKDMKVWKVRDKEKFLELK